MKVPKYNDPTVAQKGLPGTFQSFSTSSAEFGGAEARAIQGVGGQVAQLAKTMERLQDEDDATAARGLFTEYQAGESEADWGENGYYSQKGEAAYKGLSGALKDKQERKSQYIQKAQNANQQNILSKVIDARINADTESMSRHAYKERTTWQMGIEAATVESNLNNAVANTGAVDRIALERNAAYASIERIVGMKGGGAEEVALEKERWNSNLHKLTVDRLMVHDPAGANEYYKENKKSIFATERAALETKLKGVVNLEQAQVSTDKIIVDNPEDLTAQRKAAAKIKDPDVRKLTESMVSTRFNERKQERDLYEKQVKREAWRELEGMKAQGGTSSQMYSKISEVDDPAERKKMMNWMKDEASGKQITDDSDAWLDFISLDQKELEDMDRGSFQERRSKLNKEHRAKAETNWLAAKESPQKFTSIITPSAMAEKTWNMAGLGKPSGKANIRTFSQYEQEFQDQVAYFEKTELGGKRKASRKELSSILNDITTNQIMVTYDPGVFSFERTGLLSEAPKGAVIEDVEFIERQAPASPERPIATEKPPMKGARRAPDGSWYILGDNGKWRKVL